MLNTIGKGLYRILCAGALTLSAPGVANAAEYTMKMGTATVNDVQTYAMEQYAKRVEEASGGRIETELYPAAQLGSNSRMIEGLQFGTLQYYTGPAAYLVGVDSRFQVTDAPGLFRDAEHAEKVFSDSEFRKAFLSLGNDKGLVVLGIYPYGETSFVTDFPPLTPETLEGKKVRVMASELERKAVSSIGVTAVPIDFSEVSTALQQGTIDGVKTGARVFTSLKLYDIVDHLLITEEGIISELMVVSKAWFDGLPPDLQKVLHEEARALEPDLWRYALADQEKAYREWEEQGGTVHRWDPDLRAKVAKNERDASIEFLQSNEKTEEILDLIMKVAERY